MRGNDTVIAELNEALREELTAINQYFIHAELLKDEEEHVDWLEAQLHQIQEIGYERYLMLQVEGKPT